tara:strand:- start:739 stop:1353 length:615 start_codon:yes stop_codon:yes gene_type:complete
MKKSNNNKKFNKIMIVAHPDDELIFGGAELIENKGYRVLCITNQNNPIRIKEFTGLMNELKLSYEILNHPDNMGDKKVEDEWYNYVEQVLIKNKVIKIATHNKRGEYGHNFHKAVHKMVTDICIKNKLEDKLYNFHNGQKKLDKKLVDKKLELMKKYYPSQFKVIDRLGLMKSIHSGILKKYKSNKNTKENNTSKKISNAKKNN